MHICALVRSECDEGETTTILFCVLRRYKDLAIYDLNLNHVYIYTIHYDDVIIYVWPDVNAAFEVSTRITRRLYDQFINGVWHVLKHDVQSNRMMAFDIIYIYIYIHLLV